MDILPARTLVVCVLLLVAVTGQRQRFPSSPCPRVFEYLADSTGYIRVIPPRPVGRPIKLEVEFFLQATLPNKYVGELVLDHDKDLVSQNLLAGSREPVRYKLYFPVRYPLPRINRISVNGEVICQAPRVSELAGTTILLQHTLYPIGTQLSYDNSQDNNNGNTFVSGNDFESGPEGGDFGHKPNNVFDLEDVFSVVESGNRPQQGSTVGSSPPVIHWDVVQPVEIAPNRPPITTEMPRPWREPTPTQQQPPRVSITESTKDICGRPVKPNELVLGGTKTTHGDWPWIAAIFLITNRGQDFRCGGTLVNRRHVVTAAHCVLNDVKVQFQPSQLLVYLGKYRLLRFREPNVQEMEVGRIFVHPDYGNSRSLDADLAVLQFVDPAEYTMYVRPVCLWDRSPELQPVVGEFATVVGWGRDSFNSTFTQDPRAVEVPIVSQEECLFSRMEFRSVTSNRTLCAGSKNETGPCSGDSGSGLVIRYRDGFASRFRWFIRGLVSFSLYDKERAFCDLKDYVVYTDLAKFGSWLAQFVED